MRSWVKQCLIQVGLDLLSLALMLALAAGLGGLLTICIESQTTSPSMEPDIMELMAGERRAACAGDGDVPSGCKKR